MNKKEIAEIRRLMTKDKVCLNRICGCYVAGEKEKITTFTEAFLSLRQEEADRYLDIFKKALTGTVGRNLVNLAFPLSAEEEGGAQRALMDLRAGSLKDEAQVQAFFDSVIEKWTHPENYLILLADGTYDVPGRTTDGLEMEDASTDMYHFILCALCSVSLSEGGLCYNGETNQIEEAIRHYMVGRAEQAFLFPAFNDRASDIHNVLYYSGDAREFSTDITEELLGCGQPMPAPTQKETFRDAVEEALGDKASLEMVCALHENLNDMIEAGREEPDGVTIGQAEVRTLMERSGAPEAAIAHMEERFEADFGPKETLLADNIAEKRRFAVKTPDVEVKVTPERAGLMEIREIEGERCLVIPIEGEVEVNGITIG